MKAFLDKNLNKFISRKLMVWLTSTGLLISGSLESTDYIAVTLIYLGSQGLADIAKTWKGDK